MSKVEISILCILTMLLTYSNINYYVFNNNREHRLCEDRFLKPF